MVVGRLGWLAAFLTKRGLMSITEIVSLVLVIIYCVLLPWKWAVIAGLIFLAAGTSVYAVTMSPVSNEIAIIAFYFLAGGTLRAIASSIRSNR